VKLLALQPDHRLHRDQLLETLWPDLDPVSAANSLYKALHYARRALEPGEQSGRRSHYLPLHREWLALAPAGPLWVDVAAFEAAAATARARRDPLAYEAALALYTDPLLPEDRYADWTEPRRTALQETYLTLLHELARLRAAHGDLSAALALLQQAAALDPLHEAVHADLMRLYAQTGQRDQALRLYARLRQALHTELDLDPSPATQALALAIRTDRPLPPGPSPLSPSPLPPRRNLPTPTTPFVGRAQALAQLQHRLTTTRLLTLTGPGGVGKSRLALEIAHRSFDRYPDGVWLVELATLTDPALVVPAVARALGLGEEPRHPLLETLVAALAPRQLLVILDNCEHLVEACADLVARLLSAAPRVQFLVTSREALRLPGEVVWAVPPLETPDPEAPSDPTALAQIEAVRLFQLRAQAVRPDFQVTAQNAPAVARLCARLAGLPLALEMAATWLSVLSVEQLAAHLEENLLALTSRHRQMAARHQSLRAVVDWSYTRLAPAAQRLFRALAVFAGGCTLAAARAVCGPALPADLLPLLTTLVDVSLVQVEERAGAARYRLLEPLRQEAYARLVAAGEAPAVNRRHARYYLALAEAARADLAGPDQPRALDRLAGERANLRAALRWSLASDDLETAARLAVALTPFWDLGDNPTEGRYWLDQILARAAELTPGLRTAVQLSAGLMAYRQGDAPAVAALLTALATTARADPVQHAQALTLAGCLATEEGRYETAVGLFRQALAAHPAGVDDWSRAARLVNLATALTYQGALAEAATVLSEALALSQTVGAPDVQAAAWNGLGLVAWAQGELELAAARLAEGLRCVTGPAYPRVVAFLLGNLALVALDRGQTALALTQAQECLRRFQCLGSRWGMGLYLLVLGAVLAARGQPARGVRLISAGLSGLAAIGAQVPGYAQGRLAREIAGLRRALGEAAFQAAWETGRLQPLAVAVAEALAPEPLSP
jgi:predicted ATPase/DNA-binding SARP family transcriptional activator